MFFLNHFPFFCVYQLMYINHLDLSTDNLDVIGGPPPPHKFDVCALTYDDVNVVLAVDRVSETKYGKLQVSALFLLAWQF